MGRKRTSNKKDLTLWVKEDIIKKLNSLNANKSFIFTEAALKYIEEMENKEENSNK